MVSDLKAVAVCQAQAFHTEYLCADERAHLTYAVWVLQMKVEHFLLALCCDLSVNISHTYTLMNRNEVAGNWVTLHIDSSWFKLKTKQDGTYVWQIGRFLSILKSCVGVAEFQVCESWYFYGNISGDCAYLFCVMVLNNSNRKMLQLSWYYSMDRAILGTLPAVEGIESANIGSRLM